MRTPTAIVVAAAVAAVVLAGCATPSDGGSASSGTGTEGSAQQATEPDETDETEAETGAGAETDKAAGADPAPAAVPATLRFQAETVSGEPFDGADLAGKPVLLWFWAPWCPTCRSQIPQVEDIADRYGDQVGVVGVGSLDSSEAIAEFADEVEGPTHLTDVDGTVWKHFGIVEQSSFVLLDAEGGVALEAGYGGADDLADRVAALVG